MSNKEIWPDNPFWEFSLEYYDREGVAERLIFFQEHLKANVNIMLFCFWAGHVGAPLLTESEVREIESAVKFWQNDIVKPLRALRSKLKNNHEFEQKALIGNVYAEIKNAELEAERAEQLTIYQEQHLKVEGHLEAREKRNRAKSNLLLYFRCFQKKPNSEDMVLIDHLVEKLCP